MSLPKVKKQPKTIQQTIDGILKGGKPSYSALIKIILYLVKLYLAEREGVIKPEEIIESEDERVEGIFNLAMKWGK